MDISQREFAVFAKNLRQLGQHRNPVYYVVCYL